MKRSLSDEAAAKHVQEITLLIQNYFVNLDERVNIPDMVSIMAGLFTTSMRGIADMTGNGDLLTDVIALILETEEELKKEGAKDE